VGLGRRVHRHGGRFDGDHGEPGDQEEAGKGQEDDSRWQLRLGSARLEEGRVGRRRRDGLPVVVRRIGRLLGQFLVDHIIHSDRSTGNAVTKSATNSPAVGRESWSPALRRTCLALVLALALALALGSGVGRSVDLAERLSKWDSGVGIGVGVGIGTSRDRVRLRPELEAGPVDE
ncbi:unnamed protein product, partial [Protopolystoma xenopodis]